jgi:hypothetical protein
MTCNGERTEEANVPEEGGLPTSQELQQPVTDWLQRWGGDGHPRCSVCGERWSASVAEGNVALQAVPHRRSTFKFSTWRGPNTKRLSVDRMLTTLGDRLHSFHADSAPAVQITCTTCGNMVLFDAYKIGVLERPR